MGIRSIGRLIAIRRSIIEAELYDSVGSYINTLDGTRFVGEVGTYVTIYEIERTVVGEIVGIGDYAEEGKDFAFKKPSVRRRIEIALVGEILGGAFSFGVSRMPLIYSEVNLISEVELKLILSSGRTKVTDGLRVGRSVYFPDSNVTLDINKFFGFHFAVFGNTGSGKSNTVASIVQRIFGDTQRPACNARMVVFDSNGEYESAFDKIHEQHAQISVRFLDADSDDANRRLQIPVWALGVDDWAVLLHASEKTQLPIIKRALDLMPYFLSGDDRTKDAQNHILASATLGVLLSTDTSPSKADKVLALLAYFNTTDIGLDVIVDGQKKLREFIAVHFGQMPHLEPLLSYLQRFVNPATVIKNEHIECPPYDLNDFLRAIQLATLYEGSVRTQRIQEYTATLVSRLEALRDGGKGRLLTKTTFHNLHDYVEEMLGQNQLVNIDISSLDDSEGEMVVKVVTKLLLEYMKAQTPRAKRPINIIIEEAHRFVHNQNDYGAIGYDIFERVSKEGRKFGVLLGISSQRPRDLSETVVSQCSNFIIHRIQSPEDLAYIARMVPYIDKTGINRLTYLQTGHGLVFGTAINIPSLTEFPLANPQPDSRNADVKAAWYDQSDRDECNDGIPDKITRDIDR